MDALITMMENNAGEHLTPPNKATHEDQIAINAGQQRNDIVTVVLTADNHLGSTTFSPQPRKREERQRHLREALQRATDFAIAQGAHLFIQAGDLFDTATPDERDRSFVAERLAALKQAGVHSFALGGVHDTPADVQSAHSEFTAPQMSYARLGALNYLPPIPMKTRPDGKKELEPLFVDIRGIRVGICGLGVLAGQEGDPLADVRVQIAIESAAIPILVLHAPIEGLTTGTSLLDTHALVSRSSIARQTNFRYILAGYHHHYTHTRIGQIEVIVAGATQHIDFNAPTQAPGFVFMGLAHDGIRWCNHIPVDTLSLERTTIQVDELWIGQSNTSQEKADAITHTHGSTTAEASPTETILERLQPLCNNKTMIQLRLEGELTRTQYHQLDLNRIRHYGEEHCFALAIDDSRLSLLSEQEALAPETGERLSPREELITVADEWIAAVNDEQEKNALRITKEELLLAMDEERGKR